MGLWLRHQSEKRTSLVKGSSIETMESQTQQDQLYSGLPNWAEEGRKKRKVRAIFEVMACLAFPNEETPSMIEEVGDEMAALGHESKQIKLGHDGDGFPSESPKRIHSVAKSTTEDRIRSEMKYSTG